METRLFYTTFTSIRRRLNRLFYVSMGMEGLLSRVYLTMVSLCKISL